MQRYLHLYSTEQAFDADYDGEAYHEPWVSLTLDIDRVDYNKAPVPPAPVDPKTYPFTIEALESGNIVWNSGNDTLQYSKDGGTTWQPFSSPLAVNTGDKVQFKGTSTTGYAYGKSLTGTTIQMNVEGNIMSLLAGDDFETATSMCPSAFSTLFMNLTNLKSVENLALPVTDLTGAYGCYSQMFRGCTSITKSPELPATSLFQNYSNVYSQMFDGCTNLSYVKCLITGTVYQNTTDYWLRNVAASGTFVKAASMTNWTRDDNGIPAGWTVQDA